MSKFFIIIAILIVVLIEIDAVRKRKHNEAVSNDNKPSKRSRKGTPQQAWTGHLGLLKLENHSYCEVMSVFWFFCKSREESLQLKNY